MAGASEPARLSYLASGLRSLLAAEFLVLATWNPSGMCYVAWLRRAEHLTPLLMLATVVLVVGHVAMTRIALVALGSAGLLGLVVLIASAVLLASHLGLVDPVRLLNAPVDWLMLWAVTLAAGLVWAKLQKRVSGQRGVLKSPP